MTGEPTLVVNVSLTGAERDYDIRVDLFDRPFRLLRIGTGGDIAAAERLVRTWGREASAIAVTGVREARAAGLYDGELASIERVKRATEAVPVTDGHALDDVLQEWAVRHVQTELSDKSKEVFTLELEHLPAPRAPDRLAHTLQMQLKLAQMNIGEAKQVDIIEVIPELSYPLDALKSIADSTLAQRGESANLRIPVEHALAILRETPGRV